MATAQQLFTEMDEMLKQELPLFCQYRVDYLEPVLEAFMQAELVAADRSVENVAIAIATPFGDPLSDADFEARLRARVAEFEGLSIVGSSQRGSILSRSSTLGPT